MIEYTDDIFPATFPETVSAISAKQMRFRKALFSLPLTFYL